MIPTPEQVLPLVECAVPSLRKALRIGGSFADEIQPDADERDGHYWSHSARWRARKHLAAVPKDGWYLTPNVPNSGIHLRIGDLHRVRVLRSLGGTVPHPGSNRARRADWVQNALDLAGDGLPALSLLADWQIFEDEPVIHCSLPRRPWSYTADPEVYWRVPITGDADSDLARLRFDPGLLPGDVFVTVKIDPAEASAG